MRPEGIVAFMASARARRIGKVGICHAKTGPRAALPLNGPHGAKMDHVSVVAIAGKPARVVVAAHCQQTVVLQALFQDAASDFAEITTLRNQRTAHRVKALAASDNL